MIYSSVLVLFQYNLVLFQHPFQSNRFLGSSDVSLSNIDRIYQVVDKKKKLICPQVKNSNKIDKIRIICKVCLSKFGKMIFLHSSMVIMFAVLFGGHRILKHLRLVFNCPMLVKESI